jgi:hypothetical protein
MERTAFTFFTQRSLRVRPHMNNKTLYIWMYWLNHENKSIIAFPEFYDVTWFEYGGVESQHCVNQTIPIKTTALALLVDDRLDSALIDKSRLI